MQSFAETFLSTILVGTALCSECEGAAGLEAQHIGKLHKKLAPIVYKLFR